MIEIKYVGGNTARAGRAAVGACEWAGSQMKSARIEFQGGCLWLLGSSTWHAADLTADADGRTGKRVCR